MILIQYYEVEEKLPLWKLSEVLVSLLCILRNLMDPLIHEL